jgi:hypothetical protein
MAYLDTIGLALPAARVFGEHLLWTTTARYDHKRYREGMDRRAENLSLEMRPSWTWTRERISGHLRLENENASIDSESYRRLTAGLSLEHSFPKGITSSLAYRYQHTSYEERDSAFSDKRQDRLHELRGALSKQWTAQLSSELSYSHTQADSTVDLYTYDRDVVLLQMHLSF